MTYASEKNYYPFLDGFRAIAVLWVIFHHAIYHFDFRSLFGAFYQPVIRMGFLGFLGVDIFFVISGFLITGLLIDDLATKIRVKRFYCRRFFKIVPHYSFVIFVSLAFLSAVPQNEISWTAVFNYFCFLQNYISNIPVLAHLWSIAVEEHFYFLYPLMLAGITYINPHPSVRRGWLFGILVVLLFAGSYIRYCSWMGLTGYEPWPKQMSHTRFDGLILGCLLKVAEPYWTGWKPRVKEILSSVSFGVAAILWCSFYINFHINGWGYYTAVYLAVGSLILSAQLGFRPLILSTENPWLRWVGRNSYGIYL